MHWSKILSKDGIWSSVSPGILLQDHLISLLNSVLKTITELSWIFWAENMTVSLKHIFLLQYIKNQNGFLWMSIIRIILFWRQTLFNRFFQIKETSCLEHKGSQRSKGQGGLRKGNVWFAELFKQSVSKETPVSETKVVFSLCNLSFWSDLRDLKMTKNRLSSVHLIKLFSRINKIGLPSAFVQLCSQPPLPLSVSVSLALSPSILLQHESQVNIPAGMMAGPSCRSSITGYHWQIFTLRSFPTQALMAVSKTIDIYQVRGNLSFKKVPK